MNRPWMQLWTRRWLDNKELRRCDPVSRAVLVDLMCLAHEGEPYGYLSDKMGPLTTEFMASRCMMPAPKLCKAMAELVKNGRLHQSEISGAFFILQMVEDEDLRVRRASGGFKSIGHPNTHPPKKEEGGSKGTLQGYPTAYPSSRAIARADSKSSSVSGFNSSLDLGFSPEEFEIAWERHRKHSKHEAKDVCLQYILSMNGKFSATRFHERHEIYCDYWAGHGWQFCPLSFLGWVEAGMPLPPQDAKSEKENRLERAFLKAREG